MKCPKRTRIAASGLLFVAMNLAAPANATTPLLSGGRSVVLVQAMIPPSGMMDAQHPMPMNERYLRRFPQPARVGDLIGLPVLDLYSRPLGNVRQVVQTHGGDIKFIVSYSWWWVAFASDISPRDPSRRAFN
jgi:hypothetical protein